MTYQKLESLINEGKKIPFFKYIVCDEAHYFVEDADFNIDTELSFDFINEQPDSVKIFLTGTPEPLEYVKFNDPIIQMTQVDHSNHNVEEVYLTPSIEVIENQIRKELEKGNQTIVFSSNAKVAFEMSRRFLEFNPYFICSKNNRTFKSDENIREKIIEEEKTGIDVGFMTSAMDTGINFDEDIKNIVIIGSPSSVAIRQSVARVRKGKNNRKIRLILQIPHGQAIRTKIKSMERDLEYFDDDIIKWQEKYGRNRYPSFIWTDPKDNNIASIEINKLSLAKLYSDLNEFSGMSSNPSAQYELVIEKFYPSTGIFWLYPYKAEIDRFIEENIGKHLNKEQQKKTKEFFKEFGITSKSGTVGLNIIQKYLHQEKKYKLDTPKKYVDENRLTFWVFNKI